MCSRFLRTAKSGRMEYTIKLRAIEHVPRYDAGFPRNDLRIISYKILGYSAVDQ